jgi:secreted trypsin-like serine protease
LYNAAGLSLGYRSFTERLQKKKGMRRTVLLLASMALALLLAGGMAQAIINGEPDTGPNAHPYVGALVSVPPSGQFKGQRVPVCSGTLLSARVFLTAGHCTDALIKEELPTYVSFDPTYKEGASKLISATPHTHPQYDVGVVVLEEPVRMAAYGALPAKAGLVDTLKEGQHLTVVGYGENGFDIGSEPPLQPQPVLLADRSRATVRLLHTKDPDVGDQYVKTTGIGIIGGGEGACRGDSGGPLFVSDQQTIVAVTSRGIAPLCRGPTYYQRMDLPGVLHWVRSFP